MKKFVNAADTAEDARRRRITATIGEAFVSGGLQFGDRSEYPGKVARAVRDAGGDPETAAWARELAAQIAADTDNSNDGLTRGRALAAAAAEQVAAHVHQAPQESADTADSEAVFRAVHGGARPGGVRERARERARRAAAGDQERDDLSEERRRLVGQVTERSLAARRRMRQEHADGDDGEERRAVLEGVTGHYWRAVRGSE